LELIRASLTPFALPLVRSVKTGRETIDERRGILLEIGDSCGLKGWGEATPMDGFGTESFWEAWDCLVQFLPVLLEKEPGSIDRTVERFRVAFPAANAALSALDTALCDLSARQQGCSMATFLAGEFRTDARLTIRVNALLTAQDTAAIVAEAGEKFLQGFRTFKIKVGVLSVEEDLDRVGAVRKKLGDGVNIRLDANGAWTRDEAARALQALSSFDIEYIEQPLSAGDLQGSADLRGIQPVPLAADESVCSVEDMEKVLKYGAADYIILKPAAAGGPRMGMYMGKRAAGYAVPCVITTLMDGAVGRAMATHVAASLSFQQSCAAGLATGSLLSADLSGGLKVQNGKISINEVKGLGVDIDPNQLAKVASAETTEFVR